MGQLLMAHFHGEEVNEEANILVREAKVGGIIYYNWANGLTSPQQVKSLSMGLQRLAQQNHHSSPLLIAADQEGGIVARLQAGFTEFPGNRALGETGDRSFAKESARIMGQEVLSVGINMNLAPVVDINSNPKNPVIGLRSFGNDAEKVTTFGHAALEGYREAGVLTTLKHFPGHGDVGVDSHEELPVIHKSLEELENCELAPFVKLCASCDAVMTAHILVPALDPDTCATLSPKILSYLRDTLKFQGVIVTDSLVMKGVLKKCKTIDEASILALNAGCDLLILGGKLLTSEGQEELRAQDVKRIHGSIVQAVREGRIAESRIDASLDRILILKAKIRSQDLPLRTPKACDLAQKIARLALNVSANRTAPICPLSQKHLLLVAPQIVQKNIEQTTLPRLGHSAKVFYYNGLNPSPAETEAALEHAQDCDVVLVCSYNAWKNPAAIEMIRSLQTRAPLIFVSLRDPEDADLFPDANLSIRSYSPSTTSLQAISDLLTKSY